MVIKCGQDDGAVGGTAFTAPNGETLRFGASPFSYVLDVPDGPNILTVICHEQFATKPGERVFSMTIDGVPKMVDMDILRAQPNGNLVWQDILFGGRKMEFRFTTKTRSALVSFILLNPMFEQEVYRNGLRQMEGVDYTIENGEVKPSWTADDSDVILQQRSLVYP